MAVALLMGLSLGTANAALGTLTLSWLSNGGGTTVEAKYTGGTRGGTYGTGAFAGAYEGTGIVGPLYCLDLFHSFYLNQATAGWEVTPEIVPPDPDYPPPWNTREAAWVYNNYGAITTTAKAAGVQLALWEISHEQDWRTNFAATTWYVSGQGSGSHTSDFAAALTDFSVGTKGNWATEILRDLHDNHPTSGITDHATYYNPENKDGVYTDGRQGFLGKYDPKYEDVPEPGSVLLLGLTLLGAAGLGWRKRRS